MDLYDIAIAKKLAGGSGGGGGGGDFTMFTVTLINDSSGVRSFVFDLHDYSVDPNSEYWTGFYIHDDYGIYTSFDDALEIIEDETVAQELYIIPNTAIYIFSQYVSDASITGSATATTLDGEDCIRVTGDCTITIS